MQVRFFGDLRDLAGCDEETWVLPAPFVRTLLEGLAVAHGDGFRRRVIPNGRLAGDIVILVNGQNAQSLSGLDTRLLPGDVISIFPLLL